MPTIDVLYFYEHVDRELDIACAVKHIAETRYGLTVELQQHPYGELLSDLTRFTPRVVVLPNLYSSNVPYVLEWPRAIYFNMKWEQLLYRGNHKAKSPRGEFAIKYAMHHAWNQSSVDDLRALGVPAGHIFLNGNPTYALYEEPYRQRYERRGALAERYGLDAHKRWIFFPENYNWAFYDDNHLKGIIETGQTAEDVFTLRDFCRNSLDAVIAWCRDLARSGEVEVIVRPRPSTPLDEFKNAVQRIAPDGTPSLHVIKGESIREWIMASDVVASSHSTSLIEAAIVGKPAYMLEPCPVPAALHLEWHDLTPRLRTPTEFASACFADANGDTRLADWARAAMLSRGDPIVGLARFFAGLCRGQAPRPPLPLRRSLSLPGAFNLPQWMLFDYHKAYRQYQRIRRKLSPPKIVPNSSYEKDLISAADVERRLSEWKLTLGEED